MICEDCYHHLDCERQPDETGRCGFYMKKSKVEIGDEFDVNPMDTMTFDYDDIKKLFEDTDLDEEEQLKKLGG